MKLEAATMKNGDSQLLTAGLSAGQAKAKRRRKALSPEALKARGAKIAAAKIAKRATLQCEICSNPFRVAKHDLWRKRCPDCVRLGKRLCRRKIHTKICPVCKEPFITVRAEKKCCSKTCGFTLTSQRNKANGHNPQSFVDPEKWRKAMQSDERRKKLSEANTGKIRTTPKSRRFSPHHARAVEFFVRSPDNRIWHVQNITRFVHEHENLFAPSSVIWTEGPSKASIRCHASHGLATIGRGFRASWRGWTWVSPKEGHEAIQNQQQSPSD